MADDREEAGQSKAPGGGEAGIGGTCSEAEPACLEHSVKGSLYPAFPGPKDNNWMQVQQLL